MIEQLARPQAPWALRLVPPFPAVAQRILAMVNDPDLNVNELSELVRMDPSFAAELCASPTRHCSAHAGK